MLVCRNSPVKAVSCPPAQNDSSCLFSVRFLLAPPFPAHQLSLHPVPKAPAMRINMPIVRFRGSFTLNRLASGCLSLQEECLRKFAFTADLEGTEILLPKSGRRFGLGFATGSTDINPRGNLAFGDPVKETRAQSRWEVRPPNFRHHSPKVIRAGSLDSVSRAVKEKNRSFSASFNARPVSIKSTSTQCTN